MTPDAAQIERLQLDFAAVKARRFNEFYCPILHEDGFGTGLMEGHVLPAALKSVFKVRVVQRADVDNYFGHTVEPDLIDFLNLPAMTIDEFLAKPAGLKVTGADGTASDAFFASPRSKPPHPQLHLTDGFGNEISAFHVKIAPDNLPTSPTIRLTRPVSFSEPCIAGGLLKAAYLAMFYLLGYKYVFTEPARHIATTLARFIKEGGRKETAGKYFGSFWRSIHWFPHGALPFDSLRDSKIIYHFDEQGLSGGVPWGVSPLFRVNDRTVMVTLPNSADLFELYEQQLADWTRPQSIHIGCIRDRQFGIDPRPLMVALTN